MIKLKRELCLIYVQAPDIDNVEKIYELINKN